MKPQPLSHAGQNKYWAMYSSWFGQVVTDPQWMMVPIDDHLCHRGDGVFEALKWTSGRVYLFKEHLARLRKSAERISLVLPWSDADIEKLVLDCLDQGRVGRESEREAIVRIFVSRGPGNFSANPYDTVGSQLYIVVTNFNPVPLLMREKGASLGRSAFLSKPEDWAPYKTCNYLPNVMLKKEAVDRGFDFMVSFDPKGFLTESSTENVIILSRRNELLKPKKNFILQGTTMNRTFALAQSLVKQGIIDRVQEEDLTSAMLVGAKEVMIVGTTWDVLSVTSYEGQKIGSGTPGVLASKLFELIQADQRKADLEAKS